MSVASDALEARRRAKAGEAIDVTPGRAPAPPPLGLEREAQVQREQRVARGRTGVAETVAAEALAARRARARELASPWTLLKNVALGTATGAAVGLPTGVGAGPGAVIGGLTGLYGTKVSQATGDPMLGMAAETVLDPVLPATKGLLRYPTAFSRAGRRVAELGFPEALGDEGAEGAAHVVRQGVGAMKQDVNLAYDLAEKMAPPGAAVHPDLVRRVVGPKRYASIVDEFDDPDWTPDTWLDWEKLELVRSSLGDDVRAASRAGKDNLARRLGRRKDQLDGVFDELARQASGGDAMVREGVEAARPGEDALSALQGARARNTEYRSVLPARGTKPPSQSHLRGVVSEAPGERYDKATDWFHRVLTDKKGGRLEAYRQGKQAARRVGRGDEYDREMRAAYLRWLPQTQAGGPTPAVVHGAPTIARKLAATDDLADILFTKKQLDFLRENIEALSDAMGGSSMVKKVGVRGPAMNIIRTLLLGGGAGAATTDLAMGGAIVGAAGVTYGVEAVAKLYGPRMARELALRALYDPNLMGKLAKRGAAQEASVLAKRAIDSAVRRGLLTIEDVADMQMLPQEETP